MTAHAIRVRSEELAVIAGRSKLKRNSREWLILSALQAGPWYGLALGSLREETSLTPTVLRNVLPSLIGKGYARRNPEHDNAKTYRYFCTSAGGQAVNEAV